MRYWEFLIQQEGDQTWLPLETRQVEILEGRYRMAAHTSYDDTSVEVRVSQLLLDEIPPRRRVRKRKTNTNDSGLLAIFPYMQLSPGRWEIDCNSPDVIDDFLGESWHYSVQLQVTPRDEDDWAPNWSEVATQQDPSQSVEFQPTLDSPSGNLSADGAVETAEFQLQLKQQAYVTQLGQPLALAGRLSQTGDENLLDSRLWIELRDPQTASTLQEKAFDLPSQALPSSFLVTVILPDELSTQVILGAISLLDQAGKALASASFTVTTGLAQMLDAIANQPDLEFEEEISIFPGSTEAFIPSPEKSETLLTSDTPIVPKELVPSEGLTLPPQIKPPSESDLDRQPVLPEFPTEIDPVSMADEDREDSLEMAEAALENIASEVPDIPPVADDPVVSPDDISPDDVSPDDVSPDVDGAEEPLPFAEPKVFELGSIEDDDLDLELATAAQDEEPFTEEVLPTVSTPSKGVDIVSDTTTDTQWSPANDGIDQAFQKLQLRERFWQKLNLFTQDGYRHSLEVKRALQTSDSWTEGNLQSNEFVVYEPRPRRPKAKDTDQDESRTEPIQILPPTLDVPMQELVAGEWIAIKVRVPAHSYHPYVKVWMNDLQTRTVIESPRLLMQFTPNDDNELETLMRVQVPSGCLELQFAAIAVDMTTLQESRKVVQNRRVMPPDNSVPIFDDWDM